MKPAARSARAKPRGSSLKAAALELGIAYGTIQEYDKKGRVVRYADRSVDVGATRTRIDALRDPRGGRRTRATKPNGDAPTSGHGGDAAGAASTEAPTADALVAQLQELLDLTDADRRKRQEVAKIVLTEWQGKKLQMETQERAGELVEVAKLAPTWRQAAESTRDAVMGIGPAVAARLVALVRSVGNDTEAAARVEAMVNEAARKALRGLAEQPRARG